MNQGGPKRPFRKKVLSALILQGISLIIAPINLFDLTLYCRRKRDDMHKTLFTAILLLLFAASTEISIAQNADRTRQKLDKQREEEWPPAKTHSRMSLGYALQQKFKRHAEYCGFGLADNKRDYVPADISKFMGKRSLRTKVEIADIRGGGLLYYIFNGKDKEQSFDNQSFSPINILKFNSVCDPFVINPDDNFDAFVLTKNCSGFLKAALDAGIEPPYAYFKKALDTDERRQSSVVAISGTFLSPLKLILDANDSRTTEVLMQLWKFYGEHPEYINNAYYLREFEGVMIKHVSQSEENFKVESEIGVNVNGPLPARLKASLGLGRTSQNSFTGTDWETIVYADFEGAYDRGKLFSPLPTPAEIRAYFAQLKPIYQKSRDFPLMTEGVEHKHFIIIDGIPELMTQQYWDIESVASGAYEGLPSLLAEPFRNESDGAFGCRFTVSGRPLTSNFAGSPNTRPGKVKISYIIKSKKPVGGDYLRFYVDEEMQTSAQPIATLSGGEFDLSKKEDRRFALQWKFTIELADNENPVDLNVQPYIDNLNVRRSDKSFNVHLTTIQSDPLRRMYYVTIETVETFPLDLIDDHNMVNYNLSLDVHLQSQRAGTRSVRPVKGILSFPTIKSELPVEAKPASGIDDMPGQKQ